MSSNQTAEAFIIVLKRLGKWFFFVLLMIFLLIFSYIAYEKINQHIDDKPKVINEIKDIKLGEKFSDFMFKNPGFSLENNTSKKIANEKIYRNSDKTIDVEFNGELITEITYLCKESIEYTSVNGVFCNGLGDAVLQKYGKDVLVQCLKDKSDKAFLSYRVYDVSKFGVRHHVISNQVKAFTIVSPDELVNRTGVNWNPCE